MRPTDANSKRCRWPTRHPFLTASAVGLVACLAVLLAGGTAIAQQFTFHFEPAAAFWLDEPQSDRFGPGVYGALRPGIALGRVVSLQASYAFLWTPAANEYTEDGVAHSASGGVRLRPFATLQPESEQLGGLFVDANAGYVRTGDLDRFGFDAGLGYNFQVAPVFALGPVVRYSQIVQADDTPDQDANDAQFLTAGLNLSFGPAHKAKAQEVVECPECPEQKVQPCSDRDGDGVCDADDRCPDEFGPAATAGCPIVLRHDVPLVFLVQFKQDSAELLPPEENSEKMTLVHNAVAAALAQNTTDRVCIVGYASIEGTDAHNLDLSQRRATTVKNYLVAHGLPESRLTTTGLGERCQLVPFDTRELNRRVEFRLLKEGESCPTDCSK